MNSTVTNLTPYRSDWHVERAEQQELLLTELSFKGLGKRSIVFQGEGGIGKSWLYDWSWVSVKTSPGDRYFGQVNLDGRNDIVGWLEEIRISFGARGDAKKELGWGFGAFPRFDFALSLYCASRGGGDYVSPKFRRLIASQPGVEAMVDTALANAASKALKTLLGNEPFSLSMGAIIKPLLSYANVALDHRGKKSLADDCAEILQYNADSIISILPSLLAQDINDLCNGSKPFRFILLIDGYERLLNSTAARGGVNNTGWLVKLHEALQFATIFIFSRYEVDWLSFGDRSEADDHSEALDDDDSMFGEFLAPKTFVDRPSSAQDQYAVHHRIPLFTERQARDYLLKRGFPRDTIGFDEIVSSTRLPWELDLIARHLREYPLTTQAERKAFAKSQMIVRILDPRPEGERDLIRVLCFARSFSERGVRFVAERLGYGRNSATVSQFLASSLVVPLPDTRDRFRIEHHFSDRLKDPTPEMAVRYGLARRGDRSGGERLSTAAAILAASVTDELDSLRFGLQERIVILNEALSYLNVFRPRYAGVWSTETLRSLADHARDVAREAVLAGFRSEAQGVSAGYATVFEKTLDSFNADPQGAAEIYRPTAISWGVRLVELELEILAKFSEESKRNDFVDKVELWQALLKSGQTSKAGPFASYERYWYARLECRVHEFAFEMRSRAAETESYHRRLGSSLKGHSAALNVIRQSSVPEGFSEQERDEHFTFLSQTLIWSASRSRTKPKLALELQKEALEILGKLASRPGTGKRFAVDYARALVAIAKTGQASDREARLQEALSALDHASSPNNLAYLETQEKARSRLAIIIDARERREAPNSPPSELLTSLVHANVEPIATWIDNVLVPPLPFAHLLLKAIRKSSTLLGPNFKGTTYEGAFRKALISLAASSPALSRSAYHELEEIQKLRTFAPGQIRSWLTEASPHLNPFVDGAVDSSYQIALASHAEAETDPSAFPAAVEKLYSAELALTAAIADRNVPSYRHEQLVHVSEMLVRLLCADKAMNVDTAHRVAELLHGLSRRGDVSTGIRAARLLKVGFLEGLWPKQSRGVLSRALIQLLPQWSIDDYSEYVYFLRQQVLFDGQLNKFQRQAVLDRADEIESFLGMDTFVGSRLAAAKTSHERGAVDEAIQLIFGAFIAVEKYDRHDLVRRAVRQLWAELVWKKLSDLNATARGEYRSAAKPPPEIIETFAAGDRTSFSKDVLDLLASLPRGANPASKELLVAVFDRRSEEYVDFGEDVIDHAVIGEWESRRLVSQLSTIAPRDEMALRQGDPPLPEFDLANGLETVRSVNINRVDFRPMIPIRRLGLVISSRIGGVRVVCRGPYLLAGILQAFAPAAIPADSPRCRIAPDIHSRAACVVASAGFITDILRGGMWFRPAMQELLGLQRLQFMEASTKHGDAAVETEIKNFLRGFSHFRLVSLLPSEAIFQLKSGRSADVHQIRNFTRLFQSVFGGLRARVQSESDPDEEAEDLLGFGGRDLHLALHARQNYLPPADYAEIIYVRFERGSIKSARVRAVISGNEYNVSRDVLHRSGLNLSNGQIVFCTFGWNGRRVEIRSIERKMRPHDIPCAAVVESLEPSAGMANLVLVSNSAATLRLPLGLLREVGTSVQVGDQIDVVAGSAEEVIFVVMPHPANVRRHERETNEFTVSWSGGLLKDCDLVETHSGRKIRVGGKKLLKFGIMLLREGDRLRCTVSWTPQSGTIHSVVDKSRPNLRNVPGRIVDGGRYFEFVRHGETSRARVPPKVRGEPVINGVAATAHIVLDEPSQFSVVEVASIARRGEGRWYDGEVCFRENSYRFVCDEDGSEAVVPYGVMRALFDNVDQDIIASQVRRLSVRARVAETLRAPTVTDIGLQDLNEEEELVVTIGTVNTNAEFIYLVIDHDAPPSKRKNPGVYLTPTEAALHGVLYPVLGCKFRCTIKSDANGPVIKAIRYFPEDLVRDAELIVASHSKEKGPLRLVYGEKTITVAGETAIARIARPQGRKLRATLIRVGDAYVPVHAVIVPDNQLVWQRGIVHRVTDKGLILKHFLVGKTEFIPNVVLRMLSMEHLAEDTMVEFAASRVEGREFIFDLRTRDAEKPWLATAIIESFDPHQGTGTAKLIGYDTFVAFRCGKVHPLRQSLSRNTFVELDLWSYRGKLSAKAIEALNMKKLPWKAARLLRIETGYAIAQLNTVEVLENGIFDKIFISGKLIKAHNLELLQKDDLIYAQALPGLESHRLTALSVVYPIADDWEGQLEDNERLEVMICAEELADKKMKVFESLDRAVRVRAYESNFDQEDWDGIANGEILLGRVSERGSSFVLQEVVDYMGTGLA